MKLPRDIDPEVRDAVTELNQQGFVTLGSCAGHYPAKKGRGFIVIDGRLSQQDKDTIRHTLEGLGFSDLNFHFRSQGQFSYIEFAPVGWTTLPQKATQALKGGMLKAEAEALLSKALSRNRKYTIPPTAVEKARNAIRQYRNKDTRQ